MQNLFMMTWTSFYLIRSELEEVIVFPQSISKMI